LIKDVGFNSEYKKEEVLSLLEKLDLVFGIIFAEEASVDSEVEALIKEREEARKAKNFAKSDEIRDLLKEKGIILEDSANGTIWKKA
jgi:cysteinyl-tRNA synthetase